MYTYSIKNCIIPPEVSSLVGPMAPSKGHGMRLCRILRFEAWNQMTFFRDCLRAACFREAPPGGGHQRFHRDLRTATQLAEFLWLKVLASLPRKPPPARPSQKVHLVGTSDLPGPAKKVLSLGPKFCEHPSLDRTELLSLVRCNTSRTSSDDTNRCVSAGVDVLAREVKPHQAIRSGRAVSLLREAGLKLLQADKQGGFAVMPSALYNEKAGDAVLSNFRLVKDVQPSRVKKRAVQLCLDSGLVDLAASVKKANALNLSLFLCQDA
ncbi:hypothetical protein HPB48_018842 [Haemaphysalis longicornis]|uniref:Uncharacterized protein n=1 Tax=Haemaphysalis longicornis TaxID=44386 RepID=A0A9J6H4D4_HAELO|nr:hypothetical protein HPB48_018842 [Haemaphysalis longicornis]